MTTLSKVKTKAYYLTKVFDYDFYKRRDITILEYGENFGIIDYILIKTSTGAELSFRYDIMKGTWNFKNLNGKSLIYNEQS